METVQIELRRLSVDELDRKFRGTRLFTKKSDGWSPPPRTTEIVFDLTRCVEVSVAAAVNLVALVDSAVDSGMTVRVDLPIAGVTEAELGAIERKSGELDLNRHIGDQVSMRYEALLVLRKLGVLDALLLGHRRLPAGTVRIVEPSDDLADSRELSPYLRGTTQTLELRRAEIEERVSSGIFVPAELELRWVTGLSDSSIRALVKDLADVLSQGSVALAKADARSLSRTVVFEALDNVRVHAGSGEVVTSPALIGAAFVKGSSGQFELHLAMADSGAGLVTTLDPSFGINERALLAPGARDWPRDAAVALWSLHPLSTSRSPAADEPAVRGLARLHNQARYLGARVAIRSGGVRLLANTAADAEFDYVNAGFWPGTSVSLEIPLRSSARRSRIDTAQAGPINAVIVRGQTPAMIETALAAMIAAEPSDATLLVLLPELDVGTEDAATVSAVFGRLALVAGPRRLALVVPNASGSELFTKLAPLASALSADEFGEFSVPDDPVLVVGSDLQAMWWGGRGDDLGALVSAAEDAGYSTVRSPMEFIEHTRLERPTESRDLPVWLDVDGRLVLPLDVLAQELHGLVSEEVTDAIERRQHGVHTEDRLLPSLSTTARFVDTDELLKGLSLVETTAQVLGAMSLRRLIDKVGLVVTVGELPVHFANSFAEAVGFGGRVVALDPDRPSWRLVPGPETGEGQAVILTPVLHSGESVRAVGEALVRWGIRPQAVVAVLDVSADGLGNIMVMDDSVPVVSLVASPSPPAVRSQSELIADAASGSGMLSSIDYPLTPDEFGNRLAALGVGFELVHVERRNARHLIGYYDFQALLAHEEFGPYLASLVVATVQQRSPADARHVVLFPARDVAIAGRLAELVAGQLGTPHIYPVSFESDDGLVASTDSNTTATFVDWGVVTAGTARDAISASSYSGAGHVNTVILASQLDEPTEIHLNALGSVLRERVTLPEAADLGPLEQELLRRERPVFSPPRNSESVPVAFRCITRLPSITYQHATCPLCLAVSGMSDLLQVAPTAALRQVLFNKVHRLRAQPRESALGRATDLYGATLSVSERQALISVWSLMQRSLSDFAARKELLDLLASVSDSGVSREQRIETASGVCRVIAARHDLVHSPPLSYSEFRAALVDVALILAVAEPEVEVPAGLRRQAVVTLRAASKERYVQALPDLIAANVRHRSVVGETLVGALSILARRYYQRSELMVRLSAALDEAVEQLGGHRATLDPDLSDSLRTLARQARIYRGQLRVDSDQEAWKELQQAYSPALREHHHAINRLRSITRRLDDLAMHDAIETGEDKAEVLGEILELWHRSAGFLSARVLPYVSKLSSRLSSEYYEELVGDPGVWASWLEIVRLDPELGDLPFGLKLEAFSRAPETFGKSEQRNLLTEARALAQLVLYRGDEKTGNRRTALLFKWLDECPTSLPEIAELFVEYGSRAELGRDVELELDVSELSGQAEVSVFLPHGLLEELVSCIVDNMRHGNGRLSVSVRRDDSGLKLVAESIDSARSGTSGAGQDDRGAASGSEGGLVGMRRRLQEFDAELNWGTEAENFVTAINMPLWQ